MPLSVDQALREAKSHARKGEADLAAQKYKGVLQKYPKNKRAIEGLKALQSSTPVNVATISGPSRQQINGLTALYKLGKLQETLVQGEALAKQFPNEPITANLLGAVCFELGHLEQAVTNYTRALQIKPDFAEAHNNLGDVLRSLGKRCGKLQ
jgi:tetratricopeptide (TPR) repeat protein